MSDGTLDYLSIIVGVMGIGFLMGSRDSDAWYAVAGVLGTALIIIILQAQKTHEQ